MELLHIHSTYSDGVKTVPELVEKINATSATIASLCDHDSISAYSHTHELAELETKLIAGMELKAVLEGNSVEILGYGMKLSSVSPLFVDRGIVHERQVEFGTAAVSTFNQVFGTELIQPIELKPGQFSTTHILDSVTAAVQCGALDLTLYGQDGLDLLAVITSNGFRENQLYRQIISNKHCIFHTDETPIFNSAAAVICEIHRCGGVAILAHPAYYVRSPVLTIEQAAAIGVDGVECYHPSSPGTRGEQLADVVRALGLHVAVGIDYHGTEGRCPASMLDAYLNIAGKRYDTGWLCALKDCRTND